MILWYANNSTSRSLCCFYNRDRFMLSRSYSPAVCNGSSSSILAGAKQEQRQQNNATQKHHTSQLKHNKTEIISLICPSGAHNTYIHTRPLTHFTRIRSPLAPPTPPPLPPPPQPPLPPPLPPPQHRTGGGSSSAFFRTRIARKRKRASLNQPSYKYVIL